MSFLSFSFKFLVLFVYSSNYLSVFAANHFFEGVCVNYRHPDPRRGEPRVGFAPDVALPVQRVDPEDPVQNSVRLAHIDFYNMFDTFCRNWGLIFDPIRPDIQPDIRPDIWPDIPARPASQASWHPSQAATRPRHGGSCWSQKY